MVNVLLRVMRTGCFYVELWRHRQYDTVPPAHTAAAAAASATSFIMLRLLLLLLLLPCRHSLQRMTCWNRLESIVRKLPDAVPLVYIARFVISLVDSHRIMLVSGVSPLRNLNVAATYVDWSCDHDVTLCSHSVAAFAKEVFADVSRPVRLSADRIPRKRWPNVNHFLSEMIRLLLRNETPNSRKTIVNVILIQFTELTRN